MIKQPNRDLEQQQEIIESLKEMSNVYVVAECGLGWANMGEALQLIKAMKLAGASAVKFQVFDDDYCDGHPIGEKLRRNILTEDNLVELRKEASRNEMDFFATPFSVEAVRMLERVGVPRYKVRHKDATNVALLHEIRKTGKDVWISVANNTVDWEFVREYKKSKLMFCTDKYPTPSKDLLLSSRFDQSYTPSVRYHGYSDHTVGDLACIIAVARCMKIVEKHVMLSDNEDYLDRAVSLTPPQFAEMVKKLKMVEEML